MEMMHRPYLIWKSWLLCAFLLIGMLSVHAQKEYSVHDGKMMIKLGKDLSRTELKQFIDNFDLADLDLLSFLRTNNPDSLRKLGWQVELNNPKILVISKVLPPPPPFEDPAARIMMSQKNPGNFAARFPVVSPQVRYGVNRFKNKPAFKVQDSTVVFTLRGFNTAREVLLAASFTDWQYKAIKMKKSAEGWVANVKIRPGKYWYKFVVDGNWTIDEDNTTREMDDEGNVNSVYFKPNVTFVCKGHTNAKRVYLAGSFNEWNKNQFLMTKASDGWYLQMYLTDGTHTYKYVVDGNWYNEENKKDKLPDGTGGYNSVIRIGKTHLFKLNGYTNAKQVVLSGNFNSWKSDELYMTKTSAGWELPYSIGAGNYEYRFIVDGKWISDPANPVKVNGANSFFAPQSNHTFRLKGAGNAKTVYVSGTFNDWSPERYPMRKEGNDWVFRLYLPPGKHLYKFVVDGNWITDPGNKLWEQNEHQSGNSVLWIE